MDLYFGAIAPNLSEQIKGLDKDFDRDANELSRLYVRGLLTETEVRKGRERLVRKITKWQKKKDK